MDSKMDKGFSLSIPVCIAPEVVPPENASRTLTVDPSAKELTFNPTYEQLYAPVQGPANPFLTQQQQAKRNMLSGFVEKAALSDFHFDGQRSIYKDKALSAYHESAGTTLVTGSERRRKREKNDDPSDIEGYQGPWAKFQDQEMISRPDGEMKKQLDEILAKRQKLKKVTEEETVEEKSTIHVDDPVDYQGRSFLFAPREVDSGVNLRSDDPPERCYIPKKLLHTYQGHTKGVSAIRWFPNTAHLVLSCSMDSKVKLWEVYGKRRCLVTYSGHKQAVRDISFNNDGKQFLSASYDRYIKLWDTETGVCAGRFTSKKVPYVVKFNPCEDKQHLFVAGTSDKKIVCFDTRSGEIVQEYDRHLGAVNTITFIDENRRMVTTSDDKSIRLWEWNIPVDYEYIADASMHSMPYATVSPNGKWLACQSMDNKIVILNLLKGCKFANKKVFKGHMVAGYACGLDFSPDMEYLISGDADGKCVVWNWRNTKLYDKWKAHDDVCVGVLWHPHETSRVATCGWDNVVKLWD